MLIGLPIAFLFCIDIGFLNKEIIKHELTHYFQMGLFVLCKLKEINTSNIIDIPKLDLNKSELIYLFDRTEFDAQLLINLEYGLRFLYHFHYNKVKVNDKLVFPVYKTFLQYFVFLIEKFKDNICTSDEWNIILNLVKLYDRRVVFITAIRLAAASCYLNIEWKYIKNKILEEF